MVEGETLSINFYWDTLGRRFTIKHNKKCFHPYIFRTIKSVSPWWRFLQCLIVKRLLSLTCSILPPQCNNAQLLVVEWEREASQVWRRGWLTYSTFTLVPGGGRRGNPFAVGRANECKTTPFCVVCVTEIGGVTPSCSEQFKGRWGHRPSNDHLRHGLRADCLPK